MNKEIVYAWIEQILAFDTAENRSAYYKKQVENAQRKKQPEPLIVREWTMENKSFLQLRKPYNNNPILKEV